MKPIAIFLAEKLEDIVSNENWLLVNNAADELRRLQAKVDQLEAASKPWVGHDAGWESVTAHHKAMAAAPQPAQQEPVKWSDYEPDGMHHNKPAQQPVAFDVVCDDCGGSGNDRKNNNYRCAVCNGLGYSEKMLYTSPPAQPSKPLTDDEIANILPDDDTHMSLGEAFVKFARAIEAAHGIKGDA